MKIGIDARFFGLPGKGLGRYTEKLIRFLETLDDENSYEIFLSPEGFEQYTPTNTNFTKVCVPYPWYGWKEQIFYPFFLWRRNLDLVHFPHFNVPLLYRKKFFVTIHDLILLRYPTQKASTHQFFWYWIKYQAYLSVIRSAIKRSEVIFAVSRFTLQDVRVSYPEAKEKMRLTLEGVDQFCLWWPEEKKERFLHTLWKDVGRNSLRPFVLYVGNSYPHKNLETFLFLAEENQDVDFVLVGKKDYFYQRLETTIQNKKLTNIYLLGSLSDEELAILYRTATLYVFPSLYEGFGLPPLEAMQYGLPVLVSNRGSLPEMVGDAAFVSDPDERAVFLKDFQTLLYNQELRQTYQKKGIKRAATFSWEKMAEATKDVYTTSIKR